MFFLFTIGTYLILILNFRKALERRTTSSFELAPIAPSRNHPWRYDSRKIISRLQKKKKVKKKITKVTFLEFIPSYPKPVTNYFPFVKTNSDKIKDKQEVILTVIMTGESHPKKRRRRV